MSEMGDVRKLKAKRAKRFLACLLGSSLMLSTLSGCARNESEDIGRGDLIEDDPTGGDDIGRGDLIEGNPTDGDDIGRGDVVDDPSDIANAEDYFGCWEFEDSEEWLYIYGDGTYQWYEADGSSYSGGYYMDDGMLCLEDSDLCFIVDGQGGMQCSDGDILFLSELPDFTPEPFFERTGYNFDLQMDAGRFGLEDAVRYYQVDGSFYTTAYGEWALTSVSDIVVNERYREVVFRASCYFPTSSAIANSGQYYAGCTEDLFDYYTGEWMPMSTIFGDTSDEENTYSYTLDINGEEVRIDYSVSTQWENNVGDCKRIVHNIYTVRMPVDYDGLVFCASPSPYNYDDHKDAQLQAEGYVEGLTVDKVIGIDEYNALFCRIT